MELLYKNIRLRREALGMSQDELARLANYTSRSSIAKIESGAVDLSLPKLEAIATALHTSPAILLGWDIPEEIVNEYRVSVDHLAEELTAADHLQIALSKDSVIGDYKFSDDQLLQIIRYARFLMQEE